MHASNKVNNVLVLGKALVQGINGTTINAEKMYSTNFTANNKIFCLSLHYNGDNSYLFVNGKEIHKFKAKDSEIVPYPFCLGGYSKDLEVGYMRASGLIGYVYDFSVDYTAIAVDDILDVHKYLMKKNCIILKILRKLVATVITFFNLFLGENSLECISMNKKKCRARPKMIDINNNEPVIYPYSIKVNTCSGSCNNINNPYGKLCVPDVVKNINAKVFNLISRINETRQILWHETCKCVCRLSVAVCNIKQIWNDNKCRCECREDLVDKIVWDEGLSWNPSNCECECDKSCRIGEYLDYKICVYKKTLFDKLAEEFTSVIEENKIYNETSSNDCASCTVYVVLFVVFLLLCLIISGAFVCFYWHKRPNTEKNSVRIRCNPKTQVNY